MKAVLTEESETEKKYPYIGQSDEDIVLFCGKGAGVCLMTRSAYGEVIAGHSRTDWHEESFVPMKGSITLSND